MCVYIVIYIYTYFLAFSFFVLFQPVYFRMDGEFACSSKLLNGVEELEGETSSIPS